MVFAINISFLLKHVSRTVNFKKINQLIASFWAYFLCPSLGAASIARRLKRASVDPARQSAGVRARRRGCETDLTSMEWWARQGLNL